MAHNFFSEQDIKFFSKSEMHLIFSYKFKKNDARNKLIIGLGLYAGMRVSEILQLKVEDVNLKEKKFNALVLKKKELTYRVVVINDLLLELFVKYFDKFDYRNNIYMFPNQLQPNKKRKEDTEVKPYLGRHAVNLFFKKAQNAVGLPPKSIHKLRHTCAVHMLSDGSTLDEVSLYLDHSDTKITKVYADLTSEKKEKLAKNMMGFDTWIGKLKRKIKRTDARSKEIITSKPKDFKVSSIKTIGRKKEIDQLKYYFERKINILITGAGGVGKSLLLNSISGDKVIKMQEMKPVKIKLFDLTKILRENKEVRDRMEMQYPEMLIDEKGKDGLKVSHFQRRSVKENCQLINSLVIEKEFYLVIDSVDKIDRNLVEAFNELRLKFTILTTARDIKISSDEAFNNFQKIELTNLSKNDTFVLSMLIGKQRNLQITNSTMFYNQIFLQTAGNPRAIHELIQRYELENDLGIVDDQMLLNIRHDGALKEFDVSIFFLLATAFLAVFRYIRSDSFLDFRLVGAVGLSMFFIIKTWLNYTKRK